MKDKHPSLQYFGDTERKSFPLILVFGREPNTEIEIANTKGRYDFRVDKSRFWDETYEQIALSYNSTGKMFKEVCIGKNASPILFASPLPIGIDNAIKDKWAARAAIPESSCRAQIAKVFAFESIIRRVNLIVTSGIDRDEFTASRHAISDIAGNRKIPLAIVDYFGDANHRPKACLFSPAEQKRIKDVIGEFARS